MKQIYFKLTLLSDIILQKQSKGKNQSRNFISGAVFLGIVARHYDEFANPFEIFHSGLVRFSDGKPFINNKIAYKIPLCFFCPKDSHNFNEIYNTLFL